MNNTRESLTETMANLLTMQTIALAVQRAMLAFDEDDHEMIAHLDQRYVELLTDIINHVPAGQA